MNQLGCLRNPSTEALEATYIYLAEAEALVEKITDSDHCWCDTNSFAVLLHLTNCLGLLEVTASLAEVTEMELQQGVNSDRRKKILVAFNTDKLQLFNDLDGSWSDMAEFGSAA